MSVQEEQNISITRLATSLRKTLRTFINVLPIIVGMLLATSMLITVSPETISAGILGRGDFLDTLLATSFGSIAVGHPLASYLLCGELLSEDVGLIAVTALLVSWVTVGIVQLPAESLILGGRFAFYRNLICFVFAVIIAFLTVYTLQLLGMA